MNVRDMANILNAQAIVARSSNKPFYAVLFFKIATIQGTREFLRTWRQHVPAGNEHKDFGLPELHFFFSWKGLEKLATGMDNLDVADGRKAFETFFVDPTQAPNQSHIASQLGFTGTSAPDNWWHDFDNEDIHLAVYGAFDTEAHRHKVMTDIRSTATGLTELRLPSFSEGAITGHRPAGGILHFGYRDGITSLALDWNDTSQPGTINLREVVTGYPSDDYPTSPQNPGPWREFSREGSYACFTWISQDVERFERFLSEHAPTVAHLSGGNDPREWLAAQLMGRWRNGSPLMLHENAPSVPDLSNDFGYSNDPSGQVCPLTAHIRVANLRDQPLTFPNKVRFPNGPPRLTRRGFSYGPPWNADTPDSQDRGLAGLFFCGRVNEQFYTILRWINRTDFSDAFKGLPNGLNAQDAVVGTHQSNDPGVTIDLANARHRINLVPFVKYRGVAIFFAPGVSALATLANEGT